MRKRTRKKQWNVNLTEIEFHELEKTITWLGFDSRTAFVISLIKLCRTSEYEELLRDMQKSI